MIDLEKMKKHHVDTMKDQTVGELIQALSEAKHIVEGYDKYLTKHFECQGYDGYNPQKEWLSKYFCPQGEE